MLTKFTTDVQNIQALNDRPNANSGMTADQVKAAFDKAGEDLKDYINNTLTAELDSNTGMNLGVYNVMSYGAKGDGIADDTAAIQAAISASNGAPVLFPGLHRCTSPIEITFPHTQLLGYNEGKNNNVSCIIADHAESAIIVDIPSGENGVCIKGISVDGNGTSTVGLEIMDGNFDDSLFEKVFIDNINGIGYKIGENCYSGRYYNLSTGFNVDIGLRIESDSNQQSVFRDCFFFGISNGAIIGTDDDAKTGMRNVSFEQCDFTSYGTPITFYKTLHSIQMNNVWVEHQQQGTNPNVTATVVLGSATTRCEGVTWIDCYFYGNENAEYVIHWVNAGRQTLLGSTRFLGFESGAIQATGALTPTKDSILQLTQPIALSTALTGYKISELFQLWFNDSTSSGSWYKTAYFYDADGSTSSGGNAAIIRSKRTSDSSDRMTLGESYLEFGPGNAARDTGFSRTAANLLAMNAGDSFKMDGTWNGGHLIMGTSHLWFDSTGDLRVKSGAPTSDTDGNVLGTQS